MASRAPLGPLLRGAGEAAGARGGDRHRVVLARRAWGDGARARRRCRALDLRAAPGGRPGRAAFHGQFDSLRAAGRPARDASPVERRAARRSGARAGGRDRAEVVPGSRCSPSCSCACAATRGARAVRRPRAACRWRCCSSRTLVARRGALSPASCSATAGSPTSAGSAPGAGCAGSPTAGSPAARRGSGSRWSPSRRSCSWPPTPARARAHGAPHRWRPPRSPCSSRSSPSTARSARSTCSGSCRSRRAAPRPLARTHLAAHVFAATVGLVGFYLFLAPGVLDAGGREPLRAAPPALLGGGRDGFRARRRGLARVAAPVVRAA